MRLTVEATVKDLKTKRESLAQELGKIDAKIEVLSEVLYVEQPKSRTQKPGISTDGNISQFVRQIIDRIDGEFTSAEIIQTTEDLGRPITPANVYTTMTKMLANREIQAKGKRVCNGRRTTVYVKR